MADARPVPEAENRLDHFNQDRERLLAEVEHRVMQRLVTSAKRGADSSLEYVINDVCFAESKRLESSGGGAQVERWRDLSRRLLAMSEHDKQQELRALVAYYCRDVVGNFNPKVYRFITGLAPSVLGFVFSPIASVRDGVRALAQLEERISVDGELEVARTCAKRGTLVVTPTHSSNMDSPVIGFALLAAGLPTVTYGAGKNLFTNPFISFFMRNLGAYRIDRRLRFELYKDVLKEYSTVLLENGYHSLFFPGGTRCRSNIVDNHLKLGLLGTSVTAYRNSLRHGDGRRVYVLPVTINYRLVLEAETLIEDYLAETGKNRYIITDDEFSRIGRIIEFVRKMLVHEGSVMVRFGRPLDPFGNDVTDDGESLDRAGRVIDPSSFLRGADGEITDDDQRDGEYTRALGRRLVAAYPQLSVFHATHLGARVLYDAIAAQNGTRDIYRLMRSPKSRLAVPIQTVLDRLSALRARLLGNPQWGAEHPRLHGQDDAAVFEDAFRGLSTYHSKPALARESEVVHIDDVQLIFYYQNRLAHVPPGGQPEAS